MNAIMLDEYPGGDISDRGGGGWQYVYISLYGGIIYYQANSYSHLHGHLNQQTIASHRPLNLDRLLTDAKLTDRLSSLRTL